MKVNIKLPQSWDELTDRQLRMFHRIQHLTAETYDAALWLLINNVSKWQFRKRMKVELCMYYVPLSELKNNYQYIYEDVQRGIFIKNRGFVAPMDRLYDFTIERFSYADDLHNKFLETHDYNYLRHLAAVLYLKKNETFDWDLQNQRARRFNLTTKATLYAIHLCYLGCKNHLINRFPKVYPKIQRKLKKAKNKQSSFMDVVLQMSGQKFGNYNETRSTRLYTFMAEFQNTIIQHEQIK